MAIIYEVFKQIDDVKMSAAVLDGQEYFDTQFAVVQNDYFDDGDIHESPLYGFDNLEEAIEYANDALNDFGC